MIESLFNPGFSARLAQGEAARAALVDRARFAETSRGRVVEETSEADSRRFMRAAGVLSPVLAVGMALAGLGLRPSDAFAQEGLEIVKEVKSYDQCGGTVGLEGENPNADFFVTLALWSDGLYRYSHVLFDENGCAPRFVVAPAFVAPVPVAAAADCVRMEVPLGTASGNGATVNEVTVDREVIAHGDLEINGEFRADNSSATGLIQRVHASLSNPARIRTVNPAWGGAVVSFCEPADMAANVSQGVANLQSQGMRADVIDWPGPRQQ